MGGGGGVEPGSRPSQWKNTSHEVAIGFLRNTDADPP